MTPHRTKDLFGDYSSMMVESQYQTQQEITAVQPLCMVAGTAEYSSLEGHAGNRESQFKMVEIFRISKLFPMTYFLQLGCTS